MARLGREHAIGRPDPETGSDSYRRGYRGSTLVIGDHPGEPRGSASPIIQES